MKETVLNPSFKPLPKRRCIAALDPETYRILQRNFTTLMTAQMPPESFNTSYLLMHEIGEPLLRCVAPFGVSTYRGLIFHDLISLHNFGNVIAIDLQLNTDATEVPSLLQAASL